MSLYSLMVIIRWVLVLVHCTSDVSIQFDGYTKMGVTVSPLYI